MYTECKLVCLLRPGDPRTGCAVSSLFLHIRNHLLDEQLSALYATIEGQRALEVVDGYLQPPASLIAEYCLSGICGACL